MDKDADKVAEMFDKMLYSFSELEKTGMPFIGEILDNFRPRYERVKEAYKDDEYMRATQGYLCLSKCINNKMKNDPKYRKFIKGEVALKEQPLKEGE